MSKCLAVLLYVMQTIVVVRLMQSKNVLCVSSQHAKSASRYTPVFLDGWKPNANGHFFEDQIDSPNKKEALLERQQVSPALLRTHRHLNFKFTH